MWELSYIESNDDLDDYSMIFFSTMQFLVFFAKNADEYKELYRSHSNKNIRLSDNLSLWMKTA